MKDSDLLAELRRLHGHRYVLTRETVFWPPMRRVVRADGLQTGFVLVKIG